MDIDFTIDEMTPDDLDEVLGIAKVSFPAPWSRELFEKEFSFEYSYNLVARGKDRLVGYIVFWIVSEELHILDLAVHEAFRRQGVARGLIERSMEIAKDRKCRHYFLEVRKSNAAAIRLYLSFGFKEIGLRKKYYKDGEDAVVMGWMPNRAAQNN